MGGIFLNPEGNNAFTEIVNNRISKVFVDKTGFIGETINRLDSDAKLIAFTRPRRFGKTIMARMLASYYSKSVDSMGLFSTLKISAYKGKKLIDNKETEVTYKTYINKFDVIYIDMNTVDSKYLTYVKGEKVKNVADIVDFLEYQIISELKEHAPFLPILEKEQTGNTGLADALSAIHKSLGITFVLIMDEWDLVYREYRDDGELQKKFIDLLSGMFKSSDSLESFSLVYLTGILPIKKYNSQSALNNFKEYNMLRPIPYEEYFGFTKEEVEEIVKSPKCKLAHNELKNWFDGYKLNGKDIYNPNSVASAVFDGKCQSYWSGTSSNKEVVRLINMNFDGIKNDILNLIAGAKVLFDYETFQNDMVSIENKDQLFSLLVCLGYLGCEERGDGSTLRLAYVPNREIRSALSSIVRKQSWYTSSSIIERSEALFEAITSMDADRTAKIVQEIHNSPNVSLLRYNSEEALVFCVIAGLMWRTEYDYESYRELQSGKGAIDLVYVPRWSDDLPIMLIEFKRDASAEEALEQIKAKDYPSRYCELECTNDILMIGLSYNSKTKEHQCLIERFEN